VILILTKEWPFKSSEIQTSSPQKKEQHKLFFCWVIAGKLLCLCEESKGGTIFFEHKKEVSQGRENFVLTKTKLFLTGLSSPARELCECCELDYFIYYNL
jgi:hypothetical protein